METAQVALAGRRRGAGRTLLEQAGTRLDEVEELGRRGRDAQPTSSIARHPRRLRRRVARWRPEACSTRTTTSGDDEDIRQLRDFTAQPHGPPRRLQARLPASASDDAAGRRPDPRRPRRQGQQRVPDLRRRHRRDARVPADQRLAGRPARRGATSRRAPAGGGADLGAGPRPASTVPEARRPATGRADRAPRPPPARTGRPCCPTRPGADPTERRPDQAGQGRHQDLDRRRSTDSDRHRHRRPHRHHRQPDQPARRRHRRRARRPRRRRRRRDRRPDRRGDRHASTDVTGGTLGNATGGLAALSRCARRRRQSAEDAAALAQQVDTASAGWSRAPGR